MLGDQPESLTNSQVIKKVTVKSCSRTLYGFAGFIYILLLRFTTEIVQYFYEVKGCYIFIKLDLLPEGTSGRQNLQSKC